MHSGFLVILAFCGISAISLSPNHEHHLRTLQCGRNATVANGGLVEIHSPNYPSVYPNQAHCIWIVTCADPTRILSLNFQTFSTEPTYDYVRIYDGADVTFSRPIATYSGTAGSTTGPDINTYLYSTGPSLLVEFVTDLSIQQQGFDMLFFEMSRPTTSTVTLSTTAPVCHHNYQLSLTNPQALFSSPNYPNQYSDNSNCVYTFEAPAGYIMELRFTVFKTENYYDTVTIYDGDSQYCGFQTYSGSVIPPHAISSSNNLRMTFHSDTSITLPGFTGSVDLKSYRPMTSCSNGGTLVSGQCLCPTNIYGGKCQCRGTESGLPSICAVPKNPCAYGSHGMSIGRYLKKWNAGSSWWYLTNSDNSTCINSCCSDNNCLAAIYDIPNLRCLQLSIAQITSSISNGRCATQGQDFQIDCSAVGTNGCPYYQKSCYCSQSHVNWNGYLGLWNYFCYGHSAWSDCTSAILTEKTIASIGDPLIAGGRDGN